MTGRPGFFNLLFKNLSLVPSDDLTLIPPDNSFTWEWLLLATLGAGISEELFFLGLLQTRLGILWTSLLFTVGHLYYPLPGVISVFVSSLLFGWTAKHYGLWASIFLHATGNLIGGLFVVSFILLPSYSLEEAKTTASMVVASGVGIVGMLLCLPRVRAFLMPRLHLRPTSWAHTFVFYGLAFLAAGWLLDIARQGSEEIWIEQQESGGLFMTALSEGLITGLLIWLGIGFRRRSLGQTGHRLGLYHPTPWRAWYLAPGAATSSGWEAKSSARLRA